MENGGAENRKMQILECAGISRRRWFSLFSGMLAFGLRFWESLGSAGPASTQSQPAQGTVHSQPHLSDDGYRPSSLADVEGNITPADKFFVRSHHPEPELSFVNWKLRIEGKVSKPLELTFSDLIEAPTRKQEVLLECAGNTHSLISNGLWEGVALSYLLEQAALLPEAQRVMLVGADSGTLLSESRISPFARVLPLDKCLAPEAVVSFRLNDQFLPLRNGFPARAIFPGWYAMDSVKWLQRIVVLGPSDWPDAYYASGMDLLYHRWIKGRTEEKVTTRVSEILLKSSIAFPSSESRLAVGSYRVSGFAWAGERTVRAVRVSVDGGTKWNPASLEASSRPFTWVRWNYDWSAEPGDFVLMSQAQDSTGKWQPLQRDRTRSDGYELNSVLPVRCSVK